MITPTKFIEKYGLRESILGKGAYGEVHKSTVDNVVIKSAALDKLQEEIINLVYIGEVPNVLPMLDYTVYLNSSVNGKNNGRMIEYSVGNKNHRINTSTRQEDVLTLVAYPLMEGDLTKTKKEWINMKEKWIAITFSQIVLGVAHMHRKGVAHFDLKPDNILYSGHAPKNRNYYIADLGLSASGLCGGKMIEYGQTVITAPYRPPEVFLGLPYGLSADIWSLAMILIEIYLWSAGKTNKFSDSILYHDANTLFKRFGVPTELDWKGVTSSKIYQRDINGIGLSVADKTPILRKLLVAIGMSEDAIDLVGYMILMDPMKRMTIFEIMKHPYLGSRLNNVDIPKQISCFNLVKNNLLQPKCLPNDMQNGRTDALANLLQFHRGYELDYSIFGVAINIGDAYITEVNALPQSFPSIYAAAHYVVCLYHKQYFGISSYKVIPRVDESKLISNMVFMTGFFPRLVTSTSIIDVVTTSDNLFPMEHAARIAATIMITPTYCEIEPLILSIEIVNMIIASDSDEELNEDQKRIILALKKVLKTYKKLK